MLKLANIQYSCSKYALLELLNAYLNYSSSMKIYDCEEKVGVVFDDSDRISCDFIRFLLTKSDEVDAIMIEPFDGCLDFEQSKTIMLPISKRKDISAFPKELLLLQLPIYDKFRNPWFYSHFINTYYHPSCFLDFTDEPQLDEIIEMRNLNYETFIKIKNDDIVDAISKRYYVNVWIDNFYISGTEYNNRVHDIHPVLIYGYDLEKKLFHCARFELDSGLKCVEIGMDELSFSMDAAKLYFCWPSEIPFRYLKVKNIRRPHKYAVNRFLNELRNYVNGVGNRDYPYYNVLQRNTKVGDDYFGIGVTEAIIAALKGEISYKVFDYRVLHMAVESKQHICDAVQFFNQSDNVKTLIDQTWQEYCDICNEYQTIRFLWIKTARKEKRGSFYHVPQDLNVRTRMADKLEDLVAREKEVCNKLIRLFEEKLICDRELFYGNKISDNLPENIDGIDLYSPTGFFDGTLTINGEKVEITQSRADYNFIHIDTGIIFAKTINYSGPNEAKIIPFKLNLAKIAHIGATSVFENLPSDVVKPENVSTDIDNGLEWIPSTSDRERCIFFDFDEPQTISAFSICQNADEQRVLEYAVFAEINGAWKEIVRSQESLKEIPEFSAFVPVTIAHIKLQITKTEISENGFDIPRITYVGIFK